MKFFLLVLGCVSGLLAMVAAVEPQVAELSFGKRFDQPGALEEAKAPVWITGVEQSGGVFLDEPQCWQVAAAVAHGMGRLSIALDREKMNEDLVATILFDADETADLVVQLFDALGRVVDVDLFGNLVDVGREATTDTFIIPLQKHPSAQKIVLRRIKGGVKVYGIVLYPAVSGGVPNNEALKKLAAVLGDPLSPENPLLKSLQQIARRGNIALEPIEETRPKPAAPTPPERIKYPGAVAPPAGTKAPPVPGEGLVGHWNFERGDAADASGRKHDGLIRGGAQVVDGIHGRALKLRKNPSNAREVSWDSVTVQPSPGLELKDAMTVAAWVKYSTIAPRWGSQIAWFGDSQFGRDPWSLHLLTDGTLEFRTDRSVTGRPIFTVFEDEIHLSPAGKPVLNQHVAVWSPGTLEPETWYFVAGTIEKVSPRLRALKLYVNGEEIGEVKTAETVNYPTDQMWMAIGGVDTGTWQNFDGLIDEVRIYNRALSGTEIKALYGQPWGR